MASNSRAPDDDDERGAGGKLVRRRRRRRRPASLTPYQRPEDERRGWLSGLVAGAGRLISAVFRFDGSGEVVSCESEGDAREGSEGDDDIRDNHEENQGKTGLQMIKDQRVDCEPLVPKSPTKLVIEQLLQQENFTRGECNQLIEIIQSRVVDFPLPEGEADGISKVSTDISIHSNIMYPELCDKAIMEAKRWVEEQKSAIGSKAAQNSRVCSLNTALYRRDHENDKGSPVDMAKSYMQALPSWLSPTKTSGFRIPSIRICSENFESSDATFSPALLVLQDLKRKCNSAGPFDDINTTRSTRQKTSANVPVSPVFRQSESSNKTLEHEHPQTLVAMDEEVPDVFPTVNESAVPAKCSLEATASVPTESATRAGSSSSENAAKTSLPLNNEVCTETGIIDCGNPINSSEDISNANATHGGPVPTLLSESEVQNAALSSQQILVSEENQDLEEIPLSKDLVGNVASQETNLNFLHMEHKGLVEDFMNAEPISIVPENDNPTLPGGTGEIVDMTDNGTSNLPRGSEEEKLERVNDNSQSDSFTVPEVVHTDARPHHEDFLNKKKTTRSASTSTIAGASSIPSSSLEESRATSNFQDHSPTATSNGAMDAGAPNDVNVAPGNNPANKPQNGTVKPTRRSLREAPPSTSPSRGKKTIVRRGRRGRGK